MVRSSNQIKKWMDKQTTNVAFEATSGITSEERLKEIVWNASGSIVERVASSRNTPPNILRFIYDERCTLEVAKRLASNSNTPIDLLEQLMLGPTPNAGYPVVVVSERAERTLARKGIVKPY